MLQRLFSPNRIAVVGASGNPTSIGGQPVRQLRQHGYTGDIYPVNPNRDTVQGFPCVPSVDALPADVDVAVVAVRAHLVEEVLQACGRKAIPFVVILSSGFADAGAEGERHQSRLVDQAKTLGVRILGPNCIGYINLQDAVYAGFGAFFEYDFEPGRVAFVTQSGGVGGAILTLADEAGIRFSHFLHTGNEADLGVGPLLGALLENPGTDVLVTYIESLTSSAEFPALASRALAVGKPLVVWKAGTSEASAKAVVSHTGRLAGSIDRYRAVFRKWGVIEVDDTLDLIDVLTIAQSGRLAAGGRVGVVSVSGGAGVIAVDSLEDARHLTLASFATDTVDKISEFLPGFATSENPVDVTAQIFNNPGLFEDVVRTVYEQGEVDLIVAYLASVHSEVGERVAQAVVEAQRQVALPIVVVWAARESLNQSAFEILRREQIPLFRTPERAMRALDRVGPLVEARNARAMDQEAGPARTTPRPSQYSRDIGCGGVVEHDVLELLRSYGVPVPEQRLLTDASHVADAFTDLGGPVVMKLQSPDVAHKAAVGGVRLKVNDLEVARQSFDDLCQVGEDIADAEIRGVLMQRMVGRGLELICGYVHDDVLGDFLLCGMGGGNVEQLRASILVAIPASRKEIARALDEVLSSTLAHAEGVEVGAEARERCCDIIDTLQQVASDYHGKIRELEINPIIVVRDSVCAVDALAVPLDSTSR